MEIFHYYLVNKSLENCKIIAKAKREDFLPKRTKAVKKCSEILIAFRYSNTIKSVLNINFRNLLIAFYLE